MKLIYNVPNFSIRKIITGYEILDPKSETGAKQIAPKELADGDIVLVATMNTACLKRLFEVYGEKAIMLQGDDEKIEAVPFDPEKLLPSDFIALLAQEPPTRYVVHPRG